LHIACSYHASIGVITTLLAKNFASEAHGREWRPALAFVVTMWIPVINAILMQYSEAAEMVIPASFWP